MPALPFYFPPDAADPLALTLSLLIYNSNQVCRCPPLLTHHPPDDANAAMIDINMLLRGLSIPFHFVRLTAASQHPLPAPPTYSRTPSCSQL